MTLKLGTIPQLKKTHLKFCKGYLEISSNASSFASRIRTIPLVVTIYVIWKDEFHFLFHCPKYSIPREKFYNQIQQNFVDFNQLSYTELIIKLMNSQNFSVNSHLLKFVSLCNDLRTNLLSNHADDTWLTVVIIALHYHCYKL